MPLDNTFSEDELNLFDDSDEYTDEDDFTAIGTQVANGPEFGSPELGDGIAIKETHLGNPNGEYDDFDDQEDGTEESEQDVRNQLIFDVLKTKGIEDIEKIQFENEDGTIEEVSFFDLSYEEQSEILKSSDKDIDFGLNDDEVNTINLLRNNGIQLEDLIEYYKQEAIQEYTASLEQDVFEVDTFSDDELYALDLKTKYSNLTNDEIVDAVEHEKQNPVLYARKVEMLRSSYKEAEEQNRAEAQESITKQQEEAALQLHNNLNIVASSIEDIGGLDLDDTDKDGTLRMILEKDINGKSDLDKYLANPENLFKIAWLAKNGDDAFDTLHNYYRNEIDKVRKSSYDKAKKEFADKAKKTSTKATSGLVVKNSKKEPASKVSGYGFNSGSIHQDDLFK